MKIQLCEEEKSTLYEAVSVFNRKIEQAQIELIACESVHDDVQAESWRKVVFHYKKHRRTIWGMLAGQ